MKENERCCIYSDGAMRRHRAVHRAMETGVLHVRLPPFLLDTADDFL